ncbi:aldo/keto reductase [Ekhidna sp. To15]|uniref:aldo/keto reductase n=1 Tax=Ekhidna sp. To15 TaxID=3395267 RepID=UPI003F520BDB
MQKVQLGKSDLKISPIVFGAWAIGGWAWGGNDDRQALEAIKTSFDAGVTSIDTAPIYGYGHSESLVGKAIKELGRENVEILTKFGINWKTTKGEFYFNAEGNGESYEVYAYAGRDGIIQEVEDSLKRLGTDYIDLYQIHRPDATTRIEETMEVLKELQQQGKIRAIGMSNHTGKKMKRAGKVIDLASTQSPYSMVYRKIEKDIVPFCEKDNVGILAYSPLQRGLLTGKITSDYEFKGDDHRPGTKWFKEPNRSRTNEFLQKIKPIADEHGVALAQLVINWTVQRPGITAALVGARNAEQASENAKSMSFELSPEEITIINSELEKVVIDHNA